MALEVGFACLLPSAAIAAFGCGSCHLRVDRQVLCAVQLARFHQLRASGLTARHFRFERHLQHLLVMKKASAILQTDASFLFVQLRWILDDTLFIWTKSLFDHITADIIGTSSVSQFYNDVFLRQFFQSRQ